MTSLDETWTVGEGEGERGRAVRRLAVLIGSWLGGAGGGSELGMMLRNFRLGRVKNIGGLQSTVVTTQLDSLERRTITFRCNEALFECHWGRIR
jgi:hypothetical protein